MKKHIEINIWKACNNKCRFCMSSQYAIKRVWETFWLVAFNLIKKEIKTYAIKWYKSIWYIWWDISIHPNIYEIIEKSRKYWFENISIITNAMVFSDYNKAEKLILSWTTRINISIHSHNCNIEDYITQINWWFEKKLLAIDNFNKLYNHKVLKNPISINIVLNWLNYKDITKTCLYFYKIKNIKDIRINFLWNRFFFSEDDKKKLELSYTEFLPYLKELIIFSIKINLRITFDAIPACVFHKLGFKNHNFIIRKFLWEELDYIDEVSNINMDVKFNWKEQKRNELKTKFDKCNDCLYSNKCQWIWKEYVKRYWEDEFNAILF